MLIITALRHKLFFLLERSQALYFRNGSSACSIQQDDASGDGPLRFNSFTQQVCVEDAVKLPGGKGAAKEQIFRSLCRVSDIYDDSGVNIPHEMTWNTKFVDRVSEVIDELNVSAALYIRCDAAGSGKTTPASFFDLHKFTESDINYWIQVKVTTQQLVCPDLTQFSPIKDTPSKLEFTRVYGDSFISGFTEGGEFNAIVSIKLRDKTQAKEAREQLKASVLKDGSVGKTSIDGEITIAVLRRGGGDIKDEKSWAVDIGNTKRSRYGVSEESHSFSCKDKCDPNRVHQLEKFPQLKSHGKHTGYVFYCIQQQPEFPIIHLALKNMIILDFILRLFLAPISEIEGGRSELVAKDNMAEFAEMNREAKEYYQRELDLYEQKMSEQHITSNTRNTTTAVDDDASSERSWASVDQKEITSSSSIPITPAVNAGNAEAPKHSIQLNRTSSTATTRFLGTPIPPNDLVPYKANIFGLEKARRDCRLELVKIVREISAVAEDPSIASDPCRTWQYLSPSLFRMLLPIVKNLDKERIAKEMILAMEASVKVQEQLRNDLTKVKSTLEETGEKLKAKEQLINELMYAGFFFMAEDFADICLGSPYGEWCPVPLNTPVRFRSFTTRKYIDFDFTGGHSLHMYQGLDHTNQKWIITRAGPIGFYIVHPASGRYLAAGNAGADGRVYLTANDYSGNVFTFERRDDDTVWIHLADRNSFAMKPEGKNYNNGTKIVMYPHFKSDDGWYVKKFEDLSDGA
ncbi:hypothetical protein VKT23_011579 [Stygiomarasmius scandens]|uniref:Uncharacterized protein n=1 Tax=Marasmiellus scandens TaxID=2682957 RepID=A0ABR1J9F0_9AGAR